MPPQPLSRVRPNVKVISGPATQTFDRRPALAPHIAKIIGEWSYIEAHFCSFLTHLLSSEAGPVMAMLRALRSTSAQFDLLEAAAKNKLTGRLLEAFEAVMVIARRSAKKRNPIAHHIWAYCGELPDALILVEPEGFHDVFVRSAKGIVDEQAKSYDDGLVSPTYCTVYKENDFKEIIEDLQQTSRLVTLLTGYLMFPERGFSRDRIYLLLNSAPAFRTELSKLRASRQPQESPLSPPSQTEGEAPPHEADTEK